MCSPWTEPQAACLARCNGAEVRLYQAGCVSLEGFRALIAEHAAQDDRHIVVSYSRRAFLQTGPFCHSFIPWIQGSGDGRPLI